MKLTLYIKPTILTGWGTTKDAQTRFRDSVRGLTYCYSNFGSAYVDGVVRNAKYVYAYNIEVFKRGKHRKNKHYIVYRYMFPIEIFKLLNIEIKQGTRTFKIVSKKDR